MIQHMILRNVMYRPVRTFITVIAVAVEVTLVLIVVGLTTGMLSDTAKRMEGIGADIMVQPPSASIFMAFSGAPMPIEIGQRLAQIKNVRAVAPVLLQFNSTNGLDIIYGIDPESFRAVSGGFIFHAGHDLQAPNDILVDDWYAKGRDVKVGQTLHILGHDFHVAGIVEHGKGARLFVLMSTLQELSGAHDKASVFFIKCDHPEQTTEVMGAINQLLPHYEVRPLRDYLSLMTSSNLPGLATFIHSMILLAAAIGFLVILLSMYTTIIERTREIGVLKSLGASRAYIVRVILSETTALCLAGIVVGFVMSYGVRLLFLTAFPTLTIVIAPLWLLRSAAIAVGGGWVGACYPAWIASRKDPVEALAYE
ncbi:MAG TPA: ABC transporter permease [Candidatus Limnocylindrales bacterium]|nr:ABC transporter permease [Candidatus Limnocylindrales bacterium]